MTPAAPYAPTDLQRAAIESPPGSTLVCAAAGAGKTGVLTRRVVRLLEGGASLDRLLVVTFTEEAAAEMKARIRGALLDAVARNPSDARLRREILLLPGAPISTIHAFGLWLLRRHFHRVPGLDPGFRVLSAPESRLLRLETAEALVGRLHEEGAPGIPALEEALGGRRGKDLEERLLEADGFLDTLPDPDGWVEAESRRERGGEDALEPAFLRLLSAFRRDLRAAKDRIAAVDFADLERLSLRVLEDAPLAPSAAAYELRQRFVEVLVDEAQDLNPVQDRILSLVSRPGGEGAGNLFLVGDPKQCIYRFRLAEPGLFVGRIGEVPWATRFLPENFRSRRRILAAANAVFGAILSRETALVPYGEGDALVFRREDFDPALDVPVEAWILPKTGASAEDGAGIGDAPEREAAFASARILELVEGGKFRFGDVSVLLRSRPSWAEAFLETFWARGIPARGDVPAGFLDSMEVRDLLSVLRVLDNPRQDIPLASFLRSPILGPGLSNADLARVRAAEPAGDLLDALANAAARPDALGDACRTALRRIRAWRDVSRGETLGTLFARIESDVALTPVLAALPQGERRVSTLRMFLAQARAFDGFARPGLARFLRFVSDLESEGETPGGARGAPEGADAVRVLTIHQAKGLQFPVVILPALGREFTRSKAASNPVLFHRELGMAAKKPLPLSLGLAEGGAWRTLSDRIAAEERAEEARLLYVAFTRAEERLILLGSPGARSAFPRVLAAWMDARPGPDGRLPLEAFRAAKCPLDWVAPIIAARPEGFSLVAAAQSQAPPEPARKARKVAASSAPPPRPGPRISSADPGPLFDVRLVPASAPPPPVSARPDAPPAPPGWETLARAALAILPSSPASVVPARLTVTELKRRLGADEFGDADAAGLPFEAGDWAEASRPGGLSAAERGRIFHSALERIDLSRGSDEAAIRAALESLQGSGTLPPEARAALDPAVIARFLESPLGRRIRAAKVVRREVPFSLRLSPGEADPRWEAVPGLMGEFVLVQGIVDVLFSEGEGLVLVDYKTDSVSPDRAPARAQESHALQLSLYALAAERILRRRCPERWAVFLLAGASVPLHGGEPERW